MGFAVERLMNAMLFNAGGIDLVVICRRRAVLFWSPRCWRPTAGATSIQDRANAGAALRVYGRQLSTVTGADQRHVKGHHNCPASDPALRCVDGLRFARVRYSSMGPDRSLGNSGPPRRPAGFTLLDFSMSNRRASSSSDFMAVLRIRGT